METKEKTDIVIEATIKAPVARVWEYWTTPGHLIKWNHASDDWHTTHAENDLRAGGKFSARMEAKDKSFGFDFWGIYDVVEVNKNIEYTLGDGRKVKVIFTDKGDETGVTEMFEAEKVNSIDKQREGWQAILNNFKNYTESTKT